MARKPQVRYFPSRSAYYFQHKGCQHKLAVGPDDAPTGPTYLAALQRFKEILSLDTVEQHGDGNTCRVVLETYLKHIQPKRKESTVEMRVEVYTAFCDFEGFGEMPVRDLRHHHLYRLCDHYRQPRAAGPHPSQVGKVYRWGDGNVRKVIISLQCAFNWAVKTGLINKNPLKGIDCPGSRSRGRDCLVSPEEHPRILAAASRAFRPFIVVLEATGARPGEIANATADNFDAESGAIIYYAEHHRHEGEHSHKTGRKGKDRFIFLDGEALEVVRALAKKHPKGPLFVTQMGGRWGKNEIAKRFTIIREKLGMKKRLTAYSYRHTFATNWLKARPGSIETLAELMGNTAEIIRRHYSHLCGDPSYLRNELAAFRTASAAGTQNPTG